MKLIGEIITGNLFFVEVGEDATVGDLKKRIGNQENLPSDRLILMLDADEQYLLDKDEASLKDYGIQDSSRIYVFFQLGDDGTSVSPPFIDLSNDEDVAPHEDDKNEPSNDAKDPSSSVDPTSAQ